MLDAICVFSTRATFRYSLQFRVRLIIRANAKNVTVSVTNETLRMHVYFTYLL